MKYLTFSTCIMAAGLAIGPAQAQVTPPTPPVPQRAATPPRAARAPRAAEPAQWREEELQAELEQRQRAMQDEQLERQREMEQHQQEMQDAQLQRQQELEQRQQEMRDAQLERQRELQEAQLDRLREQGQRNRESMLDQATTATMVPESLDGAFLNRRPPAPWVQGDPADSLYRVAREALNRGDYRRAAQLFNDVSRRYPNSNYAYVSTYYEAFSRYRIGTTEELMAADRALRSIADGSSWSNVKS